MEIDFGKGTSCELSSLFPCGGRIKMKICLGGMYKLRFEELLKEFIGKPVMKNGRKVGEVISAKRIDEESAEIEAKIWKHEEIYFVPNFSTMSMEEKE